MNNKSFSYCVSLISEIHHMIFLFQIHINMTFHMNYKGTVVPVRVGFPETAFAPNAGGTYSFGQMPADNYIKIAFSI